MASEKQIAANRANSQLSSGPVTPEGKAICSHNALKTGLTGRTILLESDDVEAYQQLVARLEKRLAPVGEEESELVQSIADTDWRLLRIPSLESGIYALGRIEFAPQFADAEPADRKVLLNAQIYLKYLRPLTNLTLQSSRLTRQREKELAALAILQQARISRVKSQIKNAVLYYGKAIKGHLPFDHTLFGSEFSLDQMFESIASEDARNEYDWHLEISLPGRLTALRARHQELFG